MNGPYAFAWALYPNAPAILAAGGLLCSYSLSFDSPFVSGPAAI